MGQPPQPLGPHPQYAGYPPQYAAQVQYAPTASVQCTPVQYVTPVRTTPVYETPRYREPVYREREIIVRDDRCDSGAGSALLGGLAGFGLGILPIWPWDW